MLLRLITEFLTLEMVYVIRIHGHVKLLENILPCRWYLSIFLKSYSRLNIIKFIYIEIYMHIICEKHCYGSNFGKVDFDGFTHLGTSVSNNPSHI